MTALLVAASALTAVAAYLIAGRRIAVRQLPIAWAKARAGWYSDESIRGSVKAQTICMFLFWPIFLAVRTMSARMDQTVDAGDPVTLARKIDERDRRIAQLEREAGIR